MKFSPDTATLMLKFLVLEDQIAFMKTDKQNAKYVRNHLQPKWYVGQILYTIASDCWYFYYKVQRVCPKTVFMEAVIQGDGEWKYLQPRRPIRCRMKRYVLKCPWHHLPLSYYWALSSPSRQVRRARPIVLKG